MRSNGAARIGRLGIALALGGLAAPVPAHGDIDFRILLDVDGNATNNCSVTTVDGAFGGVEQVVTATVDTNAPQHTVTGVSRQICSSGVLVADLGFSPQTPLTWNVAQGGGAGGNDAVELYAPLPSPPTAALLRVGFTSQSTSGPADALLSTDGGPSSPDILIAWASVVAIPTLGEWALSLASRSTTRTSI